MNRIPELTRVAFKQLAKNNDSVYIERTYPANTYIQGLYCSVYRNANVCTFKADKWLGETICAVRDDKRLPDTELAVHGQYPATRDNPLPGQAVELDRPALYLMYPWAVNYQHWLIEDFPRVWWYHKLKAIEPDLCVVIDAYTTRPWHLEALRLYGVKDIVQYERPSHLHIDKLYVSSFCGVNFGFLSDQAFEVYAKLVEAAKAEWTSTNRFERIYVSRQDTAKEWWHRRDMINEPQIEEMLKSKGFTPIIPASLSFVDEILTFHHARHIIGASGAGMTNLLWCNDQAKCLLLEHPSLHANFFTTLGKFNSRVVKSARLTEEPPDLRKEDKANVPWEYDITALERQLEYFND